MEVLKLQSNEAKKFFKGLQPNFMTPTPLGYWETGNAWIELSTGYGIENEPIFGVSVLSKDTGRPIEEELGGRSPSDRLFWSQEDALSYIEVLLK